MWPFRSESAASDAFVDACEADRQSREEKITRELTERAKSLIPTVGAQQLDRLTKFQTALWEARAAWSFRCERYGDFLAVFYQSADEQGNVGKTVKATSLTGIKVTVANGRAPDRGATNRFSREVFYAPRKKGVSALEHLSNPTHYLEIRGADLPTERALVGATQHLDWCDSDDELPYYSSSYPKYLNVSVSGIARRSKPDIITIGDTSPAFENRPRGQGMSLSVPFGLGQEVFQQILDAIKAGEK